MSQVESSGYCPTCGQQRLMRRQGTNHVLHLILTVVTLGLWAIVWIFIAITRKNSAPFRCTVCGTQLSRHYKGPQTQNDERPAPAVPERGA